MDNKSKNVKTNIFKLIMIQEHERPQNMKIITYSYIRWENICCSTNISANCIVARRLGSLSESSLDEFAIRHIFKFFFYFLKLIVYDFKEFFKKICFLYFIKKFK